MAMSKIKKKETIAIGIVFLLLVSSFFYYSVTQNSMNQRTNGNGYQGNGSNFTYIACENKFITVQSNDCYNVSFHFGTFDAILFQVYSNYSTACLDFSGPNGIYYSTLEVNGGHSSSTSLVKAQPPNFNIPSGEWYVLINVSGGSGKIHFIVSGQLS